MSKKETAMPEPENHNNGTCPNCGYCPSCGRRNQYPSYPAYPYVTPYQWPYYPYVTYGGGNYGGTATVTWTP